MHACMDECVDIRDGRSQLLTATKSVAATNASLSTGLLNVFPVVKFGVAKLNRHCT